MGSRRQYGARTAVAVAATVVCMALAIVSVDVAEVGEVLNGIRFRYAAVGVVLFLCSTFVGMVRFPRRARQVRLPSGLEAVVRRVSHRADRTPVRPQRHRTECRPCRRSDFLRRAVRRDDPRDAGGARSRRRHPRRRGRGRAAWFLLPQLGFDFAQGGAYFLSLAGGMAVAALAAAAVARRRGGVARAISIVEQGHRTVLDRYDSDDPGPSLHARLPCRNVAGTEHRSADPGDRRRSGDRHVCVEPADQPRRMGRT